VTPVPDGPGTVTVTPVTATPVTGTSADLTPAAVGGRGAALLASTGAGAVLPMTLGGLVLLTGGGALLAASRRRPARRGTPG
jgi:hypothetical protein